MFPESFLQQWIKQKKHFSNQQRTCLVDSMTVSLRITTPAVSGPSFHHPKRLLSSVAICCHLSLRHRCRIQRLHLVRGELQLCGFDVVLVGRFQLRRIHLKGTRNCGNLSCVFLFQMNFKVWRNFFFDKTRLFNTWTKGVVCLSLANITNSRDWRGAFGDAPSNGHLGSFAFEVSVECSRLIATSRL